MQFNPNIAFEKSAQKPMESTTSEKDSPQQGPISTS